MDRILIIMKKNNGHQGIIGPFTGAFFHNMQTCLLVYTYNRSQVSVYRTIGPLVTITTLAFTVTYESVPIFFAYTFFLFIHNWMTCTLNFLSLLHFLIK